MTGASQRGSEEITAHEWRLARGAGAEPLAGDSLRALIAFLAQARAARPVLGLSEKEVVAWLAGQLSSDTELPRALSSLLAADVAVVCGCLAGRARALDELAGRVRKAAADATQRTDLKAMADDLAQEVLVKVLRGSGEAGPLLPRYTGRGSLDGWLRAIAVRTALRSKAQVERGGARETAWLALLSGAPSNPELEALQARYRDAFAEVCHRALAALPSRERSALRLAARGVPVTAIASCYQVHRATATRWLLQAKQQVLEGVRRTLGAQLGIDLSEAESLIRLLRSQLELSIAKSSESAGG
ncbi:MAG: hypothetical protein HY901_28545 [Deltaproteobacteria bacterium]|nr:hypothetical protein [Deltaproteobacteria bacterium]